MKIYIEAEERIESIIPGEYKPGEFIRIDVTDYSEQEIQQIITQIKDIMAGKTYELRRHICRHEENRGCEIEKLEV